jgi:hypothetical protein
MRDQQPLLYTWLYGNQKKKIGYVPNVQTNDWAVGMVAAALLIKKIQQIFTAALW